MTQLLTIRDDSRKGVAAIATTSTGVADAGKAVFTNEFGVVDSSLISIAGGASYRLEFTDASLSVAYLLPVAHNLGAYPTAISVFDSGGDEIEPDEITNLTINSLSINLESFAPLDGTWLVTIGA